MDTITFGGTEKQLYNLQDVYEQCEKDKPQEVEIRVYVIEASNSLRYDEKIFTQLTDDEFMNIAEEEGRVYSLVGFQEAFNEIEVDTTVDCIRFISVPFSPEN